MLLRAFVDSIERHSPLVEEAVLCFLKNPEEKGSSFVKGLWGRLGPSLENAAGSLDAPKMNPCYSDSRFRRGSFGQDGIKRPNSTKQGL